MRCLASLTVKKGKKALHLHKVRQYKGVNMQTDAQLLIGKVLQIKDKIYAKRHCIPNDLQQEWDALSAQTSCFDSEAMFESAVKGQGFSKQVGFSGSVKELSTLVSRLDTLNKEVSIAQVHH